MAKTPTTRPPGYPARRRPLKGYRSVSRPIHDRLTVAANRLEEIGDHDSASAVRAVTAPGGWRLLQVSGWSDSSPQNVTLSTTVDVKNALAAASEEFGVVLSHIAADGLRKVVAGEWVPPKTGRSRGGERAVVNVSIPEALFQQVQEVLPGLNEEAGYRITLSGAALWWLCEELGVDRGMGTMVPYRMPKPLVDHFVAAAAVRGVSLEEVVDERVRGLMDGSWDLPRPSKMAKGTWDDAPLERLSIRLDVRVRDALAEMAPRLSEEFSYRMHPGSIVRAILTAEFGEPAE